MAASIAQLLSQLPCWTSDAVLLERYVHQRDQAAFTAIVARHGNLVLRLCRRILGDAHAAEDAFQATFLILARKAHSLKQPDALPAWLYGVARRVALKAGKQSARRSLESLDETLPDSHADPLTQLSARELLDILDEEVQRLPVAQRSALVLCCLEGHTQEEAARMLGWTPGSIKGRLERGRQRLQAQLQRRGIALSAALALVVATRDRVAARVPALLLQSTVRAALHGGIDSTASALAHSVLQAMFLPKLAGVLAVTLTLALAASTTVALVYRGPAAEAPEDKKPLAPTASKEADLGKPLVRTDALGDPLPAGAIARLGTVRFRQGSRITFAAFTPDGKCLVSRGSDGVRVWDAATGKELRHFAPDTGSDRGALDFSVDLSPDGKRLAAASHGSAGPIQFWDVNSGKKASALGANLRPLVRYSPDGKVLAVSAAPTDIELWDLAEQKKLRSWKASVVQIESVAFSADSRKLLTVGSSGEIRLWDAATGRRLQEFKPPDKGRVTRFPHPMALSPDGNLLALIEENEKNLSRVRLQDSATGKTVRMLTSPAYEIVPGGFLPFLGVTFTPDGKRLITGGPDHLIRVWDVKTGEELRRLPLDYGPAASVVLSKDGKKLAAVVSAGANAIRVLDMTSGEVCAHPDGHFMAILRASLTPDGRTAITGDLFGVLFVWDAATGRIRRRLDLHESRLLWMQLSNEGRTLFTIGWDKILRVWDVASGKERKRMAVECAPSNPADLTRDGKTLAVVDARNTIRILDAASGAERHRFQAAGRIVGMKLTPDGHSLIAWSSDYKVRVWDAAAGRKLHEYSLPKGREDISPPYHPFNAALSSDGRLLAMGPMSHYVGFRRPPGFMILMDLATGQIVQRIDNLPSETALVAFSPDSRMLAWTSSFDDSTIRLLETASGRERYCLTGHRGQITALAFSADGRRLLSGCTDTTALVWDLGSAGRPASGAGLEALWSDLAGEDAARAYQAIHQLAAAPNAAIAFLRKHLRPAPAVDEKRLAHLIVELGSDDFATREKATAELQKLDEQALPAYRKALEGKPSLETRRRLEDLQGKAQRAWWDVSGERLRSLRAIEALELAGTKEARDVLETLAAGAAGARLTEQAKVALQQLQR